MDAMLMMVEVATKHFSSAEPLQPSLFAARDLGAALNEADSRAGWTRIVYALSHRYNTVLILPFDYSRRVGIEC